MIQTDSFGVETLTANTALMARGCTSGDTTSGGMQGWAWSEPKAENDVEASAAHNRLRHRAMKGDDHHGPLLDHRQK